jgi:amino acid transporter
VASHQATAVGIAPDPTMARFGYRQSLQRTLGLTALVAYGLVFMVPIAPFGIFGQVYSVSGGMVALAYGVAMLAMLFTAASYTQMVRAFPMAGSVYNYAGRGISAPVGFLAGWVILLDYLLVPGLLSLIAAVAMHATVPAVPLWGWIVLFLLFNTSINLFGLRLTALVTNWSVVAEIVVLLIFLTVAGWKIAHSGVPGNWMDAIYNPSAFTAGTVFAGVSVGMLSFLGFDGISLLAEENKGGPVQIGRAMRIALLLAGILFIVQTWVTSLFVSDPAGLIASGDPDGVAFYTAARTAGGPWLATLTATATALAWGIANNLVAQVATSRLLFAMARDRQLPAFLDKATMRRAVPVNAVLTTAGLSLCLGLYMASRSDGITLLSSLVTFGAITAFTVLHVTVIWHYLIRNRSGNYWSHLVVPLIGGGLLVAVAINANIMAQRVGLTWLGIGLVVLVVLYATGRRPSLAGQS